MLGLVARLIGGAVSPLIEQITTFGASLLRKLALFLVAAVCMVVVVAALTVAFDLWIASLAGAIAGALAVAALYLAVAVTAIMLALRGDRRSQILEQQNGAADEPAAAAAAAAEKDEKVDQFTAPILAMLASLGLRREQIAVLAGASLAKRLGPLPLVGIAIVAGFLIGRMWQGWDALLSSDLVERLTELVTPRRDPSTSDEAA